MQQRALIEPRVRVLYVRHAAFSPLLTDFCPNQAYEAEDEDKRVREALIQTVRRGQCMSNLAIHIFLVSPAWNLLLAIMAHATGSFIPMFTTTTATNSQC